MRKLTLESLRRKLVKNTNVKESLTMPRPKLNKKKPSKSVTLNEQTIKLLTALGQGNLSAGIESAFQGYLAFRGIQGLGPIAPMEHSAPNIPAPVKKKKVKR